MKGISSDFWNDENHILQWKLKKADYNNVLPVEEDPDMTVEYVLNRIKTLLQTTKAMGGSYALITHFLNGN